MAALKIFTDSDHQVGQIEQFGEKIREARLRLFKHVQRRDNRYIGEKDVQYGAAKQQKRRRY